MWNMFDYVALCCYTGYKDRVEELIPELKRVGILDRINFHWDFPSLVREKLATSIGHTRFASRGGVFYMMLNHYGIIKTAYELNCQSVLVLEDDIRFVKDLEYLETTLLNSPKDYDILLLDRNKPSRMDTNEWIADTKRIVGQGWCAFDYASSTGCYAMSRKGMEHYLFLVENDIKQNNLHNPDFYFRRDHHGKVMWEGKSKRYFAFPNLAVQCISGRNGSHCSMEGYWEMQTKARINQSNYNLSYPVITASNFVAMLYAYIKTCHSKVSRSDKGIVYCPIRCESCMPFSPNMRNELADTKVRYDKCFIWGNANVQENIQSLQLAYRDKADIVLCEDGFIRSYDTWCGDSPPRYLSSHSIVFDTNCYYFDATSISSLEKMLNDKSLVITKSQLKTARTLIDKIVSLKVSKYNHQPLTMHHVGREGRKKVLVIDQSYGDFSISRGLADETTFKEMLNLAIAENQGADIIVKTHPDTMANNGKSSKGYYQQLQAQDNIYKVTSPVNPYVLMDGCDKVYVCTSQIGFEALMAGKEVHVFGMPFYAGWGLTIDYKHLERRTNMRTLEELFYIFYCMYTHWVDPEKKCETTIDAVIDKMVSMRNNPPAPNRGQRQLAKTAISIPIGTDELFSHPRMLSAHQDIPQSKGTNKVVSRGFVGRSGQGMFF